MKAGDVSGSREWWLLTEMPEAARSQADWSVPGEVGSGAGLVLSQGHRGCGSRGGDQIQAESIWLRSRKVMGIVSGRPGREQLAQTPGTAGSQSQCRGREVRSAEGVLGSKLDSSPEKVYAWKELTDPR